MEHEKMIIEILQEKKIRTGGNCGTYFASICYDLNISFEEMKLLLDSLEKEDKIYYRIGIAGKLVFLK